MNPRLLVINPGGISTKIAVFEGEGERCSVNLEHDADTLRGLHGMAEQAAYRREAVERTLVEWGVPLDSLAAIVSRGGPLHPLRAGTYAVSQTMCDDILAGRVQTDHASLTGALIAYSLAVPRRLPSFIVDPVSVDEMVPEARLSGLHDVPRLSLWHALNSRHAARVACERRGLAYENVRVVVAHLGSGISVSAQKGGRAIDVNDANSMGPFAPQRAGGLPVTGLTELCFAPGATREGVLKRLTKFGGMMDYLGTSDYRAVRERVAAGDERAGLVVAAMRHQIAKEIGAMAAAMGGVELIVLTGGLARNNPEFTGPLSEQVSFLAPVELCPGEFEMEALAAGAWRVLAGREEARVYEPASAVNA